MTIHLNQNDNIICGAEKKKIFATPNNFKYNTFTKIDSKYLCNDCKNSEYAEKKRIEFIKNMTNPI